jgi:hypothetical protein
MWTGTVLDSRPHYISDSPAFGWSEATVKLSWPWCLTVLPDPSSIRVKNIKIVLEGKLISPSRMTPKKSGAGERWTTVLYWINTRTLSSNTSLYNAHLVTFSGEREVAFRSKISDYSLTELNIKLYKSRLLICKGKRSRSLTRRQHRWGLLSRSAWLYIDDIWPYSMTKDQDRRCSHERLCDCAPSSRIVIVRRRQLTKEDLVHILVLRVWYITCTRIYCMYLQLKITHYEIGTLAKKISQ